MNQAKNMLTGIAALLMISTAGTAVANDEYAEDRARIEDLQARYLFALDFQDPESYAATFTEDGILDYGAGQIQGREAIAGMVAGMRESSEAARAEDTSDLWPATGRHNITNIVIEVNGDTAVSASYWFHVGNDNSDRDAQVNSYGHYEDELVKVDGEWLFSKRKIYNEQVAEWTAGFDNPVVNPGEGPGLRQD